MPGQNLTRDEARHRAALVRLDSYDVALDLTGSDTTFDSTTVLRFACTQPGAETFLDLIADAVHEVTLNGRPLDPATAFADSRIRLPELAADNEVRVVASCKYSRTGEGLHRSVDPVDENVYLYTQFEAPDARRMYATMEQPDLKATFALTVVAPAGWQVVSNSPTPDPEPVRDGVARWRFAPTPRISTYITALVAGPYHVAADSYTGTGGTVPLRLFCRQSLAAHLEADDLFLITKQGFAFYEQVFGLPYPFAKYDQSFVPEFNAGAMENAGCVTHRDDLLFRSRVTQAAYESRANTVLHELAHMWFGDLVTMRWWDDLWLNESFAEFASHLASARATRFTESWTTFCNSRKNWAYRQDQLPSTHPIAADVVDLDSVWVNFDGITYAKGASALRQLFAWVGEEPFFAGLRAYFTTHAWENTELADLLAALEQASGRDLAAWSDEWLRSAGVNTLAPGFAVDAAGRFTSFAVGQTAVPEWPTLRSHRVAVGLYDRTGVGLVRRRRVELDVVGPRTEVAELVGVARPDLVLVNDDDLSYAKIRLDPTSLATLVASIDRFADSLPRALCWGAAWDMTRDAEMSASDFVALVLRGVGVESDLTAVQTLLARAQSVVERYAAPANRAALRDRWEAGLRELAFAAEPGSDHQLVFVRAYARAVGANAGADTLHGLLAGDVTLPGLAVDTDLRWHLVTQLARLGRYDSAEIDAELARDQTIQGRERAAGARAARPTAAAKESAWRAAVVEDAVPNETQRHICAGFWQPRQDDVLAPYVDRYLATAHEVYERKGVQLGGNVLTFLFPDRVDAATLAKVRGWEAGTGAAASAPTRRLVAEGRADLERALRAQERDAAGAVAG